MARSSVLPNYALRSGTTTLDTFTSTTGWTPTNATLSIDEYGLKITNTNAGGVGVATKVLSTPLDLTGYYDGGYIDVKVYIQDSTTANTSSGLYLFLGNNTGLTRYSNQSRSFTTTPGVQTLRFYMADFSNAGTLNSTAMPILAYKIWLYGAPGKMAVASIISITVGHAVAPKCVVTFDDGIASQHSIAFPYMKARNLKGTIYITKNINALTLAQMQEIYNEGWDLGNHSTNHVVFAGKTSTWSITNGSTTVTPIDAGLYSGYGVGQTVTGTGIQAGTTITAITATNITMSLPATATNSTTAVTVATPISVMQTEISTCRDWLIGLGFDRAAHHVAYPFGAYISDMGVACASQNVLTARTTVSGAIDVPAPNMFALPMAFNLQATTTLSSFVTALEAAKRRGQTLIIMCHSIVASGATGSAQVNQSVFNSIIDYLYASGIDVVTINEWYKGLTNPRKRVL